MGAGWVLFAGAAWAGGCAPPAERGFDSPGPVARLLAVSDAAAARDRSKVPNLIESLEHPDPAVRFLAAATLRDITGETMGYRPHDPEPERAKAVERWREWWRTQGPAAALPKE